MRGFNYTQIAESLQCSDMTAAKLVSDALDDQRPHADFDKYRAEHLAETRELRATLMDQIARLVASADGVKPTGLKDLVMAVVACQDREHKLANLDAGPYDYTRIMSMTDEEIQSELELILESGL